MITAYKILLESATFAVGFFLMVIQAIKGSLLASLRGTDLAIN